MAKNGKKKGDAPPKKRGKQGHFVSKRAEYLHAELDAYCKHSAAGTTRSWYPNFFKGYWSRFPPQLPFDEELPDQPLSSNTRNDASSANDEPPTNNAPPTNNDVAMTDAPPPTDAAGTQADVDDSHLTAEEKAAKKKIVDSTEAKIKNWLNYQRTHSAADQNPWSKWLRAKLRPVEDERRPRRLLDFQVYMQDDEKNTEVNRLFMERYAEHAGTKNSLKYRAEIARELFEQESEEVQGAFRRKAKEDFEEAMDEWRKEGGEAEAEADGGGLDEEARAEARIRLHATVKPLLVAIRKHTGYHVTLIAGGVINGKLDVRSVHAGTVDGKNKDTQDGVDFTRWDPKGYSGNMMKQFWRYLAAANGTPGIAPVMDAAPSTTPTDAAAPSTTADPSAIPTPIMPPAPPPPSSPPMPPAPPPLHRANSATPPPIGALLSASGSTAAAASGEEGMDVDPPPGDDDDDEGRGGTPTAFASPLQRQLRALTPVARESRRARLERMSEYELVREGNMARNKELLARTGVSSAVASLIAEVRAAGKRKPEGAGEAGRSKRAKGRGPDEDDEEYDSDENGDEDDASRQGTPTPTARRGGARGGGRGGVHSGGGAGWRGGKKNKGRVSQLTVEEDGGAPKWAADAQVKLLEGGGGSVWAGIVNMWWEREKAKKFECPARGKGASIRPKEVSGWVSRARTRGPHPPIIDTFSFAVRWWKWWESINPEWRVRKEGRLLREGEGSWDSVAQTGPNGMLNVLICLRWWYDALKGDEGAMDDWKEALADVEWALKGIIAGEGEEQTTEV